MLKFSSLVSNAHSGHFKNKNVSMGSTSNGLFVTISENRKNATLKSGLKIDIYLNDFFLFQNKVHNYKIEEHLAAPFISPRGPTIIAASLMIVGVLILVSVCSKAKSQVLCCLPHS